MSIFLLLHSLFLTIILVMNCNDLGQERDLLIQILSDSEKMGLIMGKLRNIKDLLKIAPANLNNPNN